MAVCIECIILLISSFIDLCKQKTKRSLLEITSIMTDDKESFKLVGLKLHGKTANQNRKSRIDCDSLWQKFATDNIFNLIPRLE